MEYAIAATLIAIFGLYTWIAIDNLKNFKKAREERMRRRNIKIVK